MAYTNSPLVSYTLLSPNNSGQRTHAIDRITPHCVVGQCSVESLGSLFANPSRQASSNYGIGSDGRVGMYVEEKNRSWCSSSNANDQRAITIECASDNFAPYAFKEVVYNKLVDLCVDICQRNGKNRVIWLSSKDDNKNYNPKEGEMQLTVHRYVGSQATSCVPTYTEVLTKQGWKRIDEVEIGEEIACADLDGLKISFEPIYDKVPVKSQPTYTYRDFTATLDHRMVYRSKRKEWRIDYYENLLKPNQKNYIPTCGYYSGSGLPISDDMLRFLIAVQADGSYMFENRCYVNGERVKSNDEKNYIGLEFHLKKKRKIERIKDLLIKLNLDWKENNKKDGSISIRIYNYDKVNIVQDLCEKYLHNKDFTWEWLNLSAEQADIFLSEIMLWDGCIAGKKYSSRDFINLEIVQAIATLHHVGCRRTNTDVFFTVLEELPVITNTIKPVRNIPISNKEMTQVTCVSVKTGIFLARQNGKTFIIGNCPGDWMMARMQDLADKVNARLGASSSTTPSTPSSSTDIKPIAIPTISYEKTIWTYMKGKLSNDYAVAAMLGNMYAESGLKSDNLENKKESVLGYTDATYTSAVDKNTYKYFDSDGAGYGLIQWRTKDRKANLLSFTKSAGKSVGDLNAQLDYVWQELTTTYKDLLKDLKMAKSVNDATTIILKQYIQPIGQLENMKNKRIGYAMTYLSRYCGSATPSTAPSTSSTTPSTPSTPTQTNSDEKKIWDYLYARISNAYGVAGLMGNLHAESGLRSNNLQNSFEKKYGMNDEQYCAAVDNGQISEYDFVHDGSGLGLAQWTWWTRKQNLYNMLRKERKVSIANLDGQLDYLWKELNESYKGVLNSLKIAKSVREASDVVLTQFEKPANQSEEVKKQRAGYGEAFYARYASGSANITPSTPTSGTTPSGIKVGGGKYIWQGLDYAPVFNPSYYTQRYEDLKNTFGTNELGLFNHFVTYGMRECRQASANFNVITYRNRYEDLIKAFGNDMPAYYKHYIEYGIKENRTGV